MSLVGVVSNDAAGRWLVAGQSAVYGVETVWIEGLATFGARYGVLGDEVM